VRGKICTCVMACKIVKKGRGRGIRINQKHLETKNAVD